MDKNEIAAVEENSGELIEPTKKTTPPKQPRKRNIIWIIVSIALVICCAVEINKIFSLSTEALSDGYEQAYAEEKDAAYAQIYQAAYDAAEEDYHVSNRVLVSVSEIKDVQKLEVLEVNDVEYIVINSEDNKSGITAWLEVPGKGIYVINLQAAEFVIDNDHHHILVRVPYPEIEGVTIDYANVNKLLFKDNIFNGSSSQGEETARKMLSTADGLIRKEFASNQFFYLSAQEAGKRIIECMIKQFNPDIPDLTVEVEYY